MKGVDLPIAKLWGEKLLYIARELADEYPSWEPGHRAANLVHQAAGHLLAAACVEKETPQGTAAQ